MSHEYVSNRPVWSPVFLSPVFLLTTKPLTTKPPQCPTSNRPHPPVSSVPVEMCELSELCELSRQDAMESFSVKRAKGGRSLF
jgi:hypothetical protein